MYPCTVGIAPIEDMKITINNYITNSKNKGMSMEEIYNGVKELENEYNKNVFVKDEEVTVQYVYINDIFFYNNLVYMESNLTRYNNFYKLMKDAFTAHTYYDYVIDFKPEQKITFIYK
jgi:hypothetical protein